MFARNGVAGIEDIFTGIVQTANVALPLYTQYVQVRQARQVAGAMKEQAIVAQRAAAETQRVTAIQQTARAGIFPWGTLALVGSVLILLYFTLPGGQRQKR